MSVVMLQPAQGHKQADGFKLMGAYFIVLTLAQFVRNAS